MLHVPRLHQPFLAIDDSGASQWPRSDPFQRPSFAMHIWSIHDQVQIAAFLQHLQVVSSITVVLASGDSAGRGLGAYLNRTRTAVHNPSCLKRASELSHPETFCRAVTVKQRIQQVHALFREVMRRRSLGLGDVVEVGQA